MLLLAVSLSAGAQNDISAKAECPDGLAIYISSKNKIYLGLPENMLSRKLLFGGCVSRVSDPGVANTGQRPSGPLQCVIASVEDSLVVLRRPQVAGTSPDSLYSRAMARNFDAPILRRMPILSREGGRVMFEITPFVIKAAPRGNDFKPGSEDGTCWYSEPKAFEDNASVKLCQSFEAEGLGGKATASMTSTVSVLVLPSVPMRAKLQDSRIGTFSTGSLAGGNRYELTAARDGLHPYRLANRWRLEPVDTVAWMRGEKVCVSKPIVWWIDDSFPESWKKPIAEGVLAWNAAFEAFGLKDVLQVRSFPVDDPCFDPDNLKYNCIRYIPNATANAMGPSWADPETGEIVSASVLIFNDVVRLLNNWRFVQTAQVDRRVRSMKMPDEVISEALLYAVSHEIGHTLGMLHNMAGSAAIPVDSLRSPAFTAIHGTTASIMDYARFNYVAQPSDTLVTLVPPALGEYDKYVMEWLYKPIPEARDMWEEAAISEHLIDSHEGDPFYRYGAQQSAMSAIQYDPTSRTQDLGDDAIKAGDYGIANLKYILPNIQSWIEGDDDYSHRRQLYNQLCSQYSRYISNVSSLIGGIVLYKAKTGDACTPISSARQRSAVKWLVDQIGESSWLDNPDLTSHFGLQSPQSHQIASNVALYLSNSAPVAVATAFANGSDYDVSQYYDDLYKELFVSRRKLSPQLKTLQRSLVTAMCRRSTSAAKPAVPREGGICFGESVQPSQPSVDISHSSEAAVYREVFLKRVSRYARQHKSNPHFAYLYTLTKQ